MGSDLRWRLAVEEPDSLFPGLRRREIGKGEYRGLEFLEVEARRIINRVPGAPFGFEYSINAYRGCSHACVYCLSGETPILMADGHTKPLAEVRPGDAVYGTTRRGAHRRYVITRVLDAWSTVKPAYRIALADGTQLVASGDHRFLTDRGWKHVTRSEHGESRRPFLTQNDRLMGTGNFTPNGDADGEYRSQYLGGVIGGDGPVATSGQQTSVATLPRWVLLDPAITRHPGIEGRAVQTDVSLRVEAVEPLGRDVELFDITTGTGDFIADGVVSHNCFARPTHEYLGLDSGLDFETKIVVKTNAVDLARAETAPGRWGGQLIAMGTNTDPYQPAEGRYKLTRGIIAVLAERRNPFSILTKSTLVLRDLDLLAEAKNENQVRVDFSIGTVDETVWKTTEPGTPHPRRRLEAVARLNEAGIPSGVLVAPILPGLSDGRDQLSELIEACVEAGATFIGSVLLHLRPGVKGHYLSWVHQARPDLVPQHERLYIRSSQAPKPERDRIAALVRELVAEHGGPLRDPRREAKSAPPRPLQLELSV